MNEWEKSRVEFPKKNVDVLLLEVPGERGTKTEELRKEWEKTSSLIFEKCQRLPP